MRYFLDYVEIQLGIIKFWEHIVNHNNTLVHKMYLENIIFNRMVKNLNSMIDKCALSRQSQILS